MNKKNLLLGGILAVLIIVAYVYSGPFNDWRDNRGKPDNFLASLKTDEITRIELTRGNQLATVLEKSGDRWKIANTKDFYIEDNQITAIFIALGDAIQPEIEMVSENKDKKNEFQTDESGILVRLMQSENELVSFTMGKVGSDFVSTYISQPESSKTYLIKASLSSALGHDNWYNKSIFSVDAEKINKIRFQYPAREFTIEKQEEEWVGILPYRFSVDDDKAGEIIGLMANLIATKIPVQDFTNTGLEKNLIIVETSGEDINNIFMIGDAQVIDEESDEEPLYYAKRADSDNIYLITQGQRDELDKQIWDLR